MTAYQQAHQLHSEGRLQEAEPLYLKALREKPDHEEALFWLAMLYTNLNRPLEAVNLFYRALDLNPNESGTHAGLGIALRAVGQFAEAEESFRRALELEPDTPELHFHLSSAQYAQGRTEEALQNCERALALKPDFVEAHHNRSEMLRRLGRIEEAELAERRVKSLQTLAVPAKSKSVAKRIVNSKQRQAMQQASSLHRRGLQLADAGQMEAAIAAYQKAIALTPEAFEPYVNLSAAFSTLHRYAEAETAARTALGRNPMSGMAHNNLGSALFMQNRLDEALKHSQRAVALEPLPLCYYGLGNVQMNLGDFSGAERSYRQAIALKPDYSDAHISLSAVFSLQGDLRRAWPEYAYVRYGADVEKRTFAQPEWDGAPLPDSTILLYATQGFGDMIQFVRYLPLVRERVGSVLLECYPELLRLFEGIAGADRVVAKEPDSRPPALPFDVQASVMDLPRLFETELATIPAESPYLYADSIKRQHWRERLAEVEGCKVGVSWAGRPEHRNDVKRSCRLVDFAPLAAVPGVTLFSLQKGPAAQQLLDANGFAVTDLSGDLHDFTDTAALLSELDLVISVDTALVHLAGALACPVWTLLPHFPDWRWMLDRRDSPWYPTMRLFRQSAPGAWEPVFAEAAESLRKKQ